MSLSDSSSTEISGAVKIEECPLPRTKQVQSAKNLEPEKFGHNNIAENPDRPSAGDSVSASFSTHSISTEERNNDNGAVDKESLEKAAQSEQQSFKEDKSQSGLSQKKEDVKRKVCSFFVRSGHCRYGSNCRYLHPETTKSASDSHGSWRDQQRSSARLDASSTTSTGDEASKPRPSCKFYARSGWCSYGYRCKFAHVRSREANEEVDVELDQTADTTESKDDDQNDALVSSTSQLSIDDEKANEQRRPKKSSKQKRCRFFDMGHCRSGRRCRFLHAEQKMQTPQDEDGVDDQDVEGTAPRKEEEEGGWQPARKPVGPVTSRPLAELQDGEAAKMRETELSQLKKRFPGDKLDVSSDADNPSYRFTLKPTDPDWPYDIKEFEVAVTFPLDYPISPLHLWLPEDQVVPNVILRHVSDATIEWLEARAATNKLSGRVELMMRPFLRWFDRSLMRLFTEGARKFKKEVYAKAAGFEFISYAPKETESETPDQGASEAPDHYKMEFINQEMDDERGGNDEEDGENNEVDDEGEEEEEEEERVIEEDRGAKSSESSQAISETPISSSPDRHPSSSKPSKYVSPTENRRGTEIRFPKMEMSESAATLACEKIKIRIQCSRCKDQSDLGVSPDLSMVLGCSKCQSQQAVGYRPCIIHQFSSVLGFLDLTGCIPLDLILYECKFLVSCLECSTDTVVQGIQYGQDRLMWCTKCHQKMSITMDTARFQKLVASAPEGKVEVVAVKKEKRQKDLGIREGFPLPANGACKHYKKSFRWLRFPCCGKVYPCDECHDLAELDHEMKFASRMICGFCSKEQPYTAEKPCQSCGSNVTKSRTTHWEGGTGCRNKTKMNKNDKQKFSSLNKTTSRHAKKVEEFQKGKKKK